MAHKRSVGCGARWTISVDSCPFCGTAAEDRAAPRPIDDVPGRPVPAKAAAKVAAAAPRPWWRFWD